MVTRNSCAGGVFLVITILIGLAAGMAVGNPMQGILIGTGAGIVLAVGVWLVDRRQ